MNELALFAGAGGNIEDNTANWLAKYREQGMNKDEQIKMLRDALDNAIMDLEFAVAMLGKSYPARAESISIRLSAQREALAATENVQEDRHALQVDGKHHAPCARHCEATAYGIEIRRYQAACKETEQVFRMQINDYAAFRTSILAALGEPADSTIDIVERIGQMRQGNEEPVAWL